MNSSHLPFLSTTFSADETSDKGAELAHYISSTTPTPILLKGELGAGKTTFAKGFITAMSRHTLSKAEILSPTYTYLSIYETPIPIPHFDLYRLPSQEAFIQMGFEEYLDYPFCPLIEWPEKISSLLKNRSFLIVTLTYPPKNTQTKQREIKIETHACEQSRSSS